VLILRVLIFPRHADTQGLPIFIMELPFCYTFCRRKSFAASAKSSATKDPALKQRRSERDLDQDLNLVEKPPPHCHPPKRDCAKLSRLREIVPQPLEERLKHVPP
jgi:hypothetical protein